MFRNQSSSLLFERQVSIPLGRRFGKNRQVLLQPFRREKQKGRAVEMTCRWKARKTKGRFPSLPTVPWTTRTHRELPTFPPPRFVPDGKVENQTQVFHFPTVTRDDDPCLYRFELKTKRKSAAPRPPQTWDKKSLPDRKELRQPPTNEEGCTVKIRRRVPRRRMPPNRSDCLVDGCSARDGQNNAPLHGPTSNRSSPLS